MPVRALDDILADRVPDLIKIDTDGYDFKSFAARQNACKTSGRTYSWNIPRTIFACMGVKNQPKCFRFYAISGYSTTIVYGHDGHPICLLDLGSRELGMIADYVANRPEFYYADLSGLQEQRSAH